MRFGKAPGQRRAEVINPPASGGSSAAGTSPAAPGADLFLPEAQVIFDPEGGHNHDGADSNAVDLSGDLSGDNTAATVTGIQGGPVTAGGAGDDGQFLRFNWNAGVPTHTYESPAGGSGRSGTDSPAQITADQNDYALSATKLFIRLDTDAAWTITGFAATSDGDWVWLIYVGANSVILGNLNAGSAAANQIVTGTGADVTLNPDESVAMMYDGTSAVWRLL